MINTFRNYALLLVVFIHAHIYLSEYSRVEAPYWLIYIYNNFIGYFHPASVLAAISGYLFYKDLSGDPEKWNMFLKEKYFKRIKSILIPYLFWVSLFFVVNNVLIYFAASLKPGVFINSFHDLSFTNYIKAFFYPEIAIAQHLWYLNNLLFFFAIAPLMPFLMRNNVVFVAVFIAIMLLYWFSLSKDMTQSHVIIKYRFITFFLMGSFFAYKRHYLGLFISNKLKLTLVCFVILAGIFLTQYYLPDHAALYVINSLVVPVLIFYLAYALVEQMGFGKDTMYNRSNHFLLYIIHPLVLSLLCKLLFYTGLLKLESYFFLLVSVFALTLIVIKLNTLIYHFLSRYFKNFTLKFL